jgi:hypothetical protein
MFCIVFESHPRIRYVMSGLSYDLMTAMLCHPYCTSCHVSLESPAGFVFMYQLPFLRAIPPTGISSLEEWLVCTSHACDRTALALVTSLAHTKYN